MSRRQYTWGNFPIRGAARVCACLASTVASLAVLPLGLAKQVQAQQRGLASAQAQALATRIPRPTDESQLLALVIGNADYAVKSLNNPVNDSRAMGEALMALGFEVIALENANQSAMMDAISSFRGALANGGVAVFYYAGHGVQFGQDNFLVPVNSGIESQSEIRDNGIPLDSVLDAMSRSSGTNIVILDACRDDPFGSAIEIGAPGLAQPRNAPPGTLIAYAAQPNGTADDGAAGGHGTYTAAILRNLENPNSVTDMFQRVRTEVAEETRDGQVPWTVDILKTDNKTGSTFSFASIPARHETEALRSIAATLSLESTVWQMKAERDGAGRVTAIDLSDLGLSGEIPLAVGTLSHLERLDLSGNDFVGVIPDELGNLAQLRMMDLSGNRLEGSIPAALENLTELTSLDLGSNGLIGAIPKGLGRLSRLELLDLGDNLLTGTIPAEFGSLSQLKTLNLEFNLLAGRIPPELGNLPQLNVMHLGFNELTGPVPAALGNLLELQELDLSAVSPPGGLTGVIPPELGNLPQLTLLSLRGNKLEGAIPPELGNFSRLTELELSGNELTGAIPPELGNLPQLASLNLEFNRLTGGIPPQLGNLSELGSLDLSGNELTGTIPPELGNLPQLALLNLNDNWLTGAIPPEFGNLSELWSLDLSGNELTGGIPPELGNLSELEVLDLAVNKLTGPIPPELGNLSQLSDVDVRFNLLTGAAPPEIDNLAHLATKNFGDQFPDLASSVAALEAALDLPDLTASETITDTNASISGTVRAADTNEPVAGVEITITGTTVTNLDDSGKLLTDTDGTYTAIIAAVGEMVGVSASKPDMTFVLPSWTVLAFPGAVNTDIDFAGLVNAMISGRVVGASGGPMEGVTITATSMIDATATYSAITDATGTFSVSVPSGGYILSASTSDREAAFVIPFPYQTVYVMAGESLNVGAVLEESSGSRDLATVSDAR